MQLWMPSIEHAAIVMVMRVFMTSVLMFTEKSADVDVALVLVVLLARHCRPQLSTSVGSVPHSRKNVLAIFEPQVPPVILAMARDLEIRQE